MNPLMTALQEDYRHKGISPTDVAKISGYGRSVVCHWFATGAAHREPMLSNFVNLANALGYDVVLVKRKEAPNATHPHD